MAHEKRTRSQLTLPDFNSLHLERSPFKEARSAIRNTYTLMDRHSRNFEYTVVLSPKKRRLSSPLLSNLGSSIERTPKRSKKEDDEDSENDGYTSQGAELSTSGWKLEYFEGATKPVSSNSQPIGSSSSNSPGRSRSVPPLSSQTSTPVPHLDLRTIPPSPWRSPCKELAKLRVMSVPPRPVPDFSDNDKTPTQSVKIPKATPSQPSLPHISVRGPFDFSNLPTPAKTPVQKANLAFMSPLSPLTPLPQTPFHPSSLPASNQASIPASTSVRLDSDTITVSSSSATPAITILPKSSTKPTSSSGPSHLSRTLTELDTASTSTITVHQPQSTASSSQAPSTSSEERDTKTVTPLPLHDTVTSASQNPPPPGTSARPPSSGATRSKSTKSSTRPTPVPLGGRMTRSVTLRMKERQRKELSTNSINLKSRKSMTFSKAPGAVSTPIIPKSRCSSPVKSAPIGELHSSSTAPTPSSSSTTHSASSTSTTNLTRKSIVPPTTLHRPMSCSARSRKSSLEVLPSSSDESTSRPALSNLSMALEKLSVPAPLRPNTSMGFNADTDQHVEKNTTLNKGKQKAETVHDLSNESVTGRKSTGRLTSNAPLKKSATITSYFPPINSLSTPVPSRSNSGLKTQASAGLPRPSSMFITPKSKSNATRSIVGVTNGLRASNAASRIFGRGGGIVGNRVFERVSKKSTLPSVLGSPVKGGGCEEDKATGEVWASTSDASTEPSLSSNVLKEKACEVIAPDHDRNEAVIHNEASGSGSSEVDEKGKERQQRYKMWRKNASRRASLASEALSQSLSSLPQSPSRDGGSMGPPTVPKYPGLRSASSTYPSSSSSGSKNVETGAFGRNGESHVSSAQGEGDSGKKRGVLKVLRECIIFVDIRTDDGDDASSLFVDMLKGLGARILSRVGQTCTHIVYKNGLTSTLTRYRLLDDPKPFVVGIAWVVECAEQRDRVDESRFRVDLDGVNVAGTVKRRRSMLPKQIPILPRESPDGVHLPPNSLNRSMECEPGNHSVDKTPSHNDEDDLPPLEKARRRKSILLKN